MFIKKIIDRVWAWQRIRFDLVAHQQNIYLAYYNQENNMTIVKTDLEGNILQKSYLPENAGRDSHHAVNLGLDPNGYIHVSGNMHKDPLSYYRSKRAYDISSFDAIHQMIGEDEESCTYPVFFEDKTWNLYFRYRTGKAWNGNVYINVYHHNTKARSRLVQKPILDGEGKMNAYIGDFILWPDGRFHTYRVWRDNPNCETNHTLEYAKTKDFKDRFTADNKKIKLPIRECMWHVVDPVKIEQGMLNGSIQIGFDLDEAPVISYHKFDAQWNTQIFNARFEGKQWKIYQTSHRGYRRDFSWWGTIEIEIDVFGVYTKDGKLMQRYKHKVYWFWLWELDPLTFHIIRTIEMDTELCDILTPKISERVVHTNPMHLESHYILRWETYPPNRDKKRENILEENLSSDLTLLIQTNIVNTI